MTAHAIGDDKEALSGIAGVLVIGANLADV
jgi:hypothetical protein